MGLLADRLDLNIEYAPRQTWSDAYEAAKNRQLDILIASGRDPERELYFKFTGPYLAFRSVIVVRNDTPFVADISALLQKKFAVVRDYNETRTLLRRYPKLDV